MRRNKTRFMSTQTGGEGETIQAQQGSVENAEDLTNDIVPQSANNQAGATEMTMPVTEPNQTLDDSEQQIGKDYTEDLSNAGSIIEQESQIKEPPPIATVPEEPKDWLKYSESQNPLFIINKQGEQENVLNPTILSPTSIIKEPNIDLDSDYIIQEPEISEGEPILSSKEDIDNYKNSQLVSQYGQESIDYVNSFQEDEAKKQEQIVSNNSFIAGNKPSNTAYEDALSNLGKAKYRDISPERSYGDLKYGMSSNMETFLGIFNLNEEEIQSIAEEQGAEATTTFQTYVSQYQGYSNELKIYNDIKNAIDSGFSAEAINFRNEGVSLNPYSTYKGKLSKQDIAELKIRLTKVESRMNDFKNTIDNFEFESKIDVKSEEPGTEVSIDLYSKFEKQTDKKLKDIYTTHWKDVSGTTYGGEKKVRYLIPNEGKFDVFRSDIGPERSGYMNVDQVKEYKQYAKWLDTEGRKLIERDVAKGTNEFMKAEKSKFPDVREKMPYALELRNDLFEIEAHKKFVNSGKIDNYTYSGFKATAKRLSKENQKEISLAIKDASEEIYNNGVLSEESWVEENKKILMSQISNGKKSLDDVLKNDIKYAMDEDPEIYKVYETYSGMIVAATDEKQRKQLNKEMINSLKKFPSIASSFKKYESAIEEFSVSAQSEYLSKYYQFKQDLYDSSVKDLKSKITLSLKSVYKQEINNDLNIYESANRVVKSEEFKKATYWGKRKIIESAWNVESARIESMVESKTIYFPKNESESGKHWSEWTGKRAMTDAEYSKWKSELPKRTGQSARANYIFYAIDDLLYSESGKPTVYAIQSFAKEQMAEIKEKKKSLGIKDYNDVIGGDNAKNYPIKPNEAKQMYLTEQYLQKIIDTPETDQGTWTELINGFTDGFQLPFIGSILGIQDAKTLKGAVDRYGSSSMDGYDISLVDAYSAMNKLAAIRPNTTAYNVGSGVGFTTTFMLEMAMTGGINALGKSTGSFLVESVASIGKSSTDDVVRGAVSTMAQSTTALDKTKTVVGIITGGAAEAVVNPRAYEDSVKRTIDNVVVQESGAYDGLISVIDRNSGEGAFEAAIKGYTNYIGMTTIERLGGYMPFNKATKAAMQYMGTSTFMKRTLVGAMMRKYGFKSVSEAAEFASTTAIPWSGFAPEMIEEILQGGWEAIVTGDKPLFGLNAPEFMGGEMHYMGMTAEELKVTAMVVGLFGGIVGPVRSIRANIGSTQTSIETVDNNGVSSITNIDKEVWSRYNSMMSDENLTWKSIAQIMSEDDNLSSEQELALTNVFIQMRGKEILEDEGYQAWKEKNSKVLETKQEIRDKISSAKQAAYDALTDEQKKKYDEGAAAASYEYMTVGKVASAEDFARSPISGNPEWSIYNTIYQNEETLSNPVMTIETENEDGTRVESSVDEKASELAEKKKERKKRDKKLTKGGARGAKEVAKQRDEAAKKEDEGIQFDMPKTETGEEVKTGRTRKSSLQQPFDLSTQTEQQDDTENVTGVSGEVAKGQEPIQTEPVTETGKEETSPSGVVQETGQEEEKITPAEIDSLKEEEQMAQMEVIKINSELERKGLTAEQIVNNPEFLAARNKLWALAKRLDEIDTKQGTNRHIERATKTEPSTESTGEKAYSDIEQVATNSYVDKLSNNRIDVSNGRWLVKQETTGEVFHSANSLEEAIAWQEEENRIVGRTKAPTETAPKAETSGVSEKRPQDELIDDYQFYSDELESLEQEENKTEEDINRIEELKKNISELEPEIEEQSLAKIKAVRAIENEFYPIENEVSETAFEERKSKAVSLAKKLNKNGYISDDALNEVVIMSKDKESTIDDLIYEIETDIRINKSQRLDEVESKYSTAKTESTTTPVTTTAPVKKEAKTATITEDVQSKIDALNERINEIYDNNEDDTDAGAAELKILNERITELESGKKGAQKSGKAAPKAEPKVAEVETTPVAEEEEATEVEETEKAPVKITAKGRAVAQKMIDEKPLTIKDQEYIMSNQEEIQAAMDEIEGKTDIFAPTETETKPATTETKKEVKPKAEPVQKKETKPKAKSAEPKAKVDSDGFVSVESNTRGMVSKPEYDESGKLIPKGFYSVSISEDGKKASVKDSTGRLVVTNAVISQSDSGNRFVVAPGGATVYVDKTIMSSAPVTEKTEKAEPTTGTYNKRVSSFYEPGKKTANIGLSPLEVSSLNSEKKSLQGDNSKKAKDRIKEIDNQLSANESKVSPKAAEIEKELQYDTKSPEFSGTPVEAGISDKTGKPYAKIIDDAYYKSQITEQEYNALNDFLETKKQEYYSNKAKTQEQKEQEAIQKEASDIIKQQINSEDTTPEDIEILQDEAAQDAVEVAISPTKGKGKKKRPGLSATRRRGATNGLVESVIARLQKAFPGYILGVDTDQDAFQAAARATGRSSNSAAIIFEGVIYLNDRVANTNTAMEEFAHIYLLVMEQNNNPLYKKGINMVQNNATEYISEVMDDSGYYYIHENQKWEDLSKQQQEKVAFEALSKMIADRGESILDKKNRRPIITFLVEFWNKIGRLLYGFTNKLDVMRDDINTYTDLIAQELIKGRPVSTITPEQAEILIDKKFESVENEKEFGRLKYVPLESSSVMMPKMSVVASARRVLAANKGVGDDLGIKLSKPSRQAARVQQQAKKIVDEMNKGIKDYIKEKKKNGEDVKKSELLIKIDQSLKNPEVLANWIASDPYLAISPLAASIWKMRDTVDSLSKQLSESGLFGDNLVASINANQGMYLHTSYFIFSKAAEESRKNWLSNFNDSDREEILDWIYNGSYSKAVSMDYSINNNTGEITVSFKNNMGVSTKEISFNGVDALKDYVANTLDIASKSIPASSQGWAFTSQKGEIDLGAPMNISKTGLKFDDSENKLISAINQMVSEFDNKKINDFINLQQQAVSSAEASVKKRKKVNMDEAKRKFLMEIEDPIYNFSNTIAKQAGLLYKSGLEQQLLDLDYIAFDSNPYADKKGREGNYRKVTSANSNLYGKWVPTEIYDILFGTDLISDKSALQSKKILPTAVRMVYQGSAYVKMALTTLSPGGNAANYVSGWFQLYKTGALPMPLTGKTYNKAALQIVGSQMDTKSEIAYVSTNLLPAAIRAIVNLTGRSKNIRNIESGMGIDIQLTPEQKIIYNSDSFEDLSDKQKAEVIAGELIEMGIMNSSIEAEILKNLVEYAFSNVEIPSSVVEAELGKLGKARKVTKKVSRAVSRGRKNVVEAYGNAYSFSDSTFKVMMYLEHKAFNMRTYGEEMRRNGMTEEEIHESIKLKTANQVRTQMPTYDRSPEFIRFISRLPLIGPFVQFDFQNKVNDKNIVLDATKMMTVDAPRMIKNGMVKEGASVMAKGAYKMGNALFSQYATYLIYSLFASAFGWDDDDDEAFRKVLPSYGKYNTHLHIDSDKTGIHTYIDINRVMPQALYLKYFRAMQEGGMSEFVKEFFTPYVQEDIFTGSISQTYLGINKYGQYDETLKNAELLDKLDYLINERLLSSTAIGQAKKIIRAVKGEEAMEGVPAETWNEVMNVLIGIKIRSIKLDVSFANRILYNDYKEMTTKKQNYKDSIKAKDYRISQMERGVEAATPEDVERLRMEVQEEHAAYTEYMDKKMNELYDLADSYRKLGFSDEELLKAMNDKGVPKYLSRAIINRNPIEFDVETGERTSGSSSGSGSSGRAIPSRRAVPRRRVVSRRRAVPRRRVGS